MKKQKKSQKADQNQLICAKTFVWRYLFASALGAALTALCFVVFQNNPLESIENSSSLPMNGGLSQSQNQNNNSKTGKRSVMELLALSDKELKKIDVLEMSIAVAREAKGFEYLDYNYYNQLIDSWTQQFLMWLPTVEQEYYQDPPRWKNDINFARLGALAQWLDQAAGMHYIPEHIVRQKKELGVEYKDLRQMLVFGLIDTKEGTCATMPVLQVVMARKCGWPVFLICVKHHYMLRYDDGKNRYNLEATDTGRGGFAIATDDEVMKEMQLSPQAVACGSDLRSLTNREMMAVFIAARARYYRDTNQMDLADRDYSLARFLFPQWRSLNYMNQPGYVWRAAELFKEGEYGHPYTMINTIYGYLPPKRQAVRRGPVDTPNSGSIEEIERLNEENRRHMNLQFQQNTTTDPYNPNTQTNTSPTQPGPTYPNPGVNQHNPNFPNRP
jgi:hypothetical protein